MECPFGSKPPSITGLKKKKSRPLPGSLAPSSLKPLSTGQPLKITEVEKYVLGLKAKNDQQKAIL